MVYFQFLYSNHPESPDVPGALIQGSATAVKLRPTPLGLLQKRLISIVGMVVVVIVSVVVMVIMVVGHRVADGRAANSAHHGADRTANNSSANGACDPSGYRPALVS
jgi:hypothetical protein